MALRGGRRARGPQRERVEGPGLAGGRSGQRQGTWGDGSPARRPSGSAAAALLGLTARPEPQRFQRRRPHDPPPRARPIKSAPTPLRLRRWLLAHIPGGRRLCSLPQTWRRRRRRGVGGKGKRKTGSAAAARGERKRSRSRWSRRCQSRPSVSAVGPRQCPFLSPIVNITGRLSPWHTLNQTFWPGAPAPRAHSLEASNGKRAFIGRRPPSLPCQHVRLRADTGLAAGWGRRNRRVGRAETEDWAEGRGTRMQCDLSPRCRRFRQAFGEAEEGC